MLEDSGSSQGVKHVWTPEEDDILIECLVEMRVRGKYMVENGFRPGFLGYVEEFMKQRISGCRIKGNPHVQSRLKTLKACWQAVYDVLHGQNISGFSWDAEKKVVVADKSVWDKYLKSHKKAALFRYKPFPYFERLCTVWVKDSPCGKDAEPMCDMVNNNEKVNTSLAVPQESCPLQMSDTGQGRGQAIGDRGRGCDRVPPSSTLEVPSAPSIPSLSPYVAGLSAPPHLRIGASTKWKDKKARAKRNWAIDKGASSNTGGSISTAEHMKKLELPRDPPGFEIMDRTKKLEGNCACAKAAEVATESQRHQGDGTSSEGESSLAADDAIFLHLLKGRKRKGNVWLQDDLSRLVMAAACPPSSSPTSGDAELVSLRAKVAALKLELVSMDALLSDTRKRLKRNEQTLKYVLQHLHVELPTKISAPKAQAATSGPNEPASQDAQLSPKDPLDGYDGDWADDQPDEAS
ncbi:hypothetical protein L6164_021010 [Bauhinia variegata]|uniref:Uncharacterized protein n=1 Tax=Bauhinia variegata TaxID=167791 RepID=A0ACB9MWZ9_BAUVA|nr:hypothetical protein L6164_021010 [Bauhinia variegata]